MSETLFILWLIIIFRIIMLGGYGLKKIKEISKEIDLLINQATIEDLIKMNRDWIGAQYKKSDWNFWHILDLTKWTYKDFYGEVKND